MLTCEHSTENPRVQPRSTPARWCPGFESITAGGGKGVAEGIKWSTYSSYSVFWAGPSEFGGGDAALLQIQWKCRVWALMEKAGIGRGINLPRACYLMYRMVPDTTHCRRSGGHAWRDEKKRSLICEPSVLTCTNNTRFSPLSHNKYS